MIKKKVSCSFFFFLTAISNDDNLKDMMSLLIYSHISRAGAKEVCRQKRYRTLLLLYENRDHTILYIYTNTELATYRQK